MWERQRPHQRWSRTRCGVPASRPKEHPTGARLTALRGSRADMKKAPGKPQGLVVVSSCEPPSSSVIHAAHAAARHGRRFLLRMFGDRRLGGDDQTRDRRGVLKGCTDDLGRIDDSELEQVAKLAGLRIIAVVIFLGFEQLADHHGAVCAGVVDDLACRSLNRLADNVDAGLLIGIDA